MIGRVGAWEPMAHGHSVPARLFEHSLGRLAMRTRELTLDRRFNLLQRTRIIQGRQIARIFAFGNRLNAPPQ